MPRKAMNRIWKLIIELGKTDAQPIANCVVVLMLVGGIIVGVSMGIAAQPYHYKVQCTTPVSSESRIVLTSRRTGLVSPGPSPNVNGLATITSDNDFNGYDITLDDRLCDYVQPK